ncbi:hypothetical protein [Halapricum desulfuricans]|uniref:Uncharacterized protein n=1 Tax=Halapricum desulfuricans TaxID=2841257 RepID=A0A897MYG2_9EURY|nr:hypothetical protein [Halapricum desulfuricans]QSG07130.1 Uncharacterized protein HSR121_2810 [Halapricum desulfuricans]
MVGLPVKEQKIQGLYRDLINDISIREENLRDALPVEATAELPAHLRSTETDWESGRKSLRTVPAVNAYTCELEQTVEDAVLRMLTGLDANVNVLDDVIDSQTLTAETRIRLTVNAAFSSVLITENLPTGRQDEAGDLLRDYFTALFQIPLVEQRLFNEMEDAENDSARVTAGVQIYSYRSRDIDAFARLPALVAEVTPATKRRLVQDLRTYRARRLLFKDIHDVPRDMSDNDMTPVIHLLQHHQSVDETVDAVERIYAAFEYSTQGTQQYSSLLKELEGVPPNLRALLQEAMHTVTNDSD